ncbi:MAG: hypothetical protein QM632_04600 [Micrococcaceae bacterium]
METELKKIEEPIINIYKSMRFWIDIFVSLLMLYFFIYVVKALLDFLQYDEPKHRSDYIVLFSTLAITLALSCGYYAFHAFQRNQDPHAAKSFLELIVEALGKNVLLIVCLVVVPFLVAVLGEKSPLDEGLENMLVRLGLYSGLAQVFLYVKDNVEGNLRSQKDEKKLHSLQTEVKHLK